MMTTRNWIAVAMFACFPLFAEDFENQSKGLKKAPLTEEKANYQGWKLVWSDEFNKDGPPDPANWNFETGFVRNREMQWYQSGNAWCKGGFLVIEGRKEAVPNPRYEEGSDDWKKNRPQAEYTSASLLTRGKHAWQYGRFEIRAKFPHEEGMWPAFWTLGVEEQWPASGEIDIMEFYQQSLLANLCWGSEKRFIGEWSTTKTPLKVLREKDPRWDDKFHVYRMDWDENTVSLYVDDFLLNRTDISRIKNASFKKVENPFRQPHYMILNLALGSTGGNLDGVRWPKRYVIDYVRVYQKKEPAR